MKADEVKGESQKEKEVRETRLKMREAMIVKSFINYHHSFRTLYTEPNPIFHLTLFASCTLLFIYW